MARDAIVANSAVGHFGCIGWGRVLKELGRDSKVWTNIILITLSIRVTKGDSAGTSLLREGYLEGGEVMVDRVSCQRWWKIMRTWLEESSLPTLMERSRRRWLRWKEACSWVSLKEGGGKQVRVPGRIESVAERLVEKEGDRRRRSWLLAARIGLLSLRLKEAEISEPKMSAWEQKL